VTTHPAWCDETLCAIDRGGEHQSKPVQVTAVRSRTPRVQALLVATSRGPTRVRVIVHGDLVINAVDLDLRFAALFAEHLTGLVRSADSSP
jgi:hypothetical protein